MNQPAIIAYRFIQAMIQYDCLDETGENYTEILSGVVLLPDLPNGAIARVYLPDESPDSEPF